MPTDYTPIACELHDRLEAAATLGGKRRIVFRDPDAGSIEVLARIVDVFAKGGEEFIRIDSGALIRLDRIESLDGLRFRVATLEDLPELVRMLADDPLGARRERYEDPLPRSYIDAFGAIDANPDIELTVAELDGRVAGMLQLMFIPNLSYQGRWRAMIEGVRVDSAMRGQRIGRALIEHAVARARERGCHMVQLTSDKNRTDALRFYERLGFGATHEGMKLHLQ
ncbi:MAG: GNAT family N-acetyltransferase [Longimicrobiales bacterium]